MLGSTYFFPFLSTDSHMAVKRMQLFELLRRDSLLSRSNTIAARNIMVDYLKCNMPHLPEEIIKNKISLFSNKIGSRWKSSGKNIKSFLKRNNDWLNAEICQTVIQSSLATATTTPTSDKRKRGIKNFESLSTRSKRRRTEELVSKHNPDELLFASQSSLTKTGKRNVAHAIKKAVNLTPRKLRVFRRDKLNQTKIKKYTPNEALALITDTKLTKSQYIKIRDSARNSDCDLYPSYDEVLNAKKCCYPEQMRVTETLGEIKLQCLLNHIVNRLAIVQNEVLSRMITEHDLENLEMTYKWGFDGSSNHSMYKQKFYESFESTDSDLLLTSIVPLKLTAKNDQVEEILWMNPRTSSTRFCIPIKIEFIKESKNVITRENEYIEQQIDALLPTHLEINGKTILVFHNLLKTMLDGKVANAIAGNPSTQSCYICKISPKDLNNLDKVHKQRCNFTTYNYGLSTLHAHIRFFECILHIAYRLDIKTWQVRGSENKALYEAKKKEIISRFRQECGLLIDTVKQGAGNTNDGNCARRFFKNPQKAAVITKIDENLIRRFSYILQALSCGYKINTENFRVYAHDTAKLFVELYGWYRMPASVHKILIHGADVMDSLLLPIGQLSEEALEARHKDCRYFREHNTRKIGRKENIEDLLHALLISSDMVISSLRPLPKRKLGSLKKEVLDLLLTPEIDTHTKTVNEDNNENIEDSSVIEDSESEVELNL